VVTQCGSSKSRASSSARKFCLRVEKKEKEMFSKFLRGAVLATLAVGATGAQADPFGDDANGKLSYLSPQPPTPLTVTVTEPGSGTKTVSAGLMSGFFDNNGDGTNDQINFFYFFCVDLAHWATSSYTNYSRTTDLSPISTEDAARLGNLFDKYVPNGTTLGTVQNSPSAVSPANSAALQLAIWNIIYDNDDTVAVGTFSASKTGDQTVLTLANTMIVDAKSEAADAAQWTYTFYRFNSTCTGGGCPSQDYLAFVRSQPQNENFVPLPGTLALFGIGLAGLGLARRKS
jgi:hypothetical protein